MSNLDDPSLITALIAALCGDDGLKPADGYPTPDSLKILRTYTGTPAELVEVILKQSFGRMGAISVTEDDEKWGLEIRRFKKVRLATGGWSGNESMIDTLEHTYFWFRWWESTHRGGGYYFHVPIDKWNEYMPFWPPAMEGA